MKIGYTLALCFLLPMLFCASSFFFEAVEHFETLLILPAILLCFLLVFATQRARPMSQRLLILFFGLLAAGLGAFVGLCINIIVGGKIGG